MFAGKTLWQAFALGGFSMYLLLVCSILTLGVIIDRYVSFWKKSRVKRAAFMDRIRDEVKKRDIARAIEICRDTNAPFARVVLAGLDRAGRSEKVVAGYMERQITVEMARLERFTGILGTVGNISVYLGLLGTVLGIIRAFRDITTTGAGGMDIVIGGVAEALITTAAGLIIAVPAVIFFNYFTRRVDSFVSDMELCASEVSDLVAR